VLVSVLAATTLAFHPVPAGAQGGDNNTAVATNTKDGSSVFKIAFSIRKVTDGEVDQQNAAVAYSSCNDCQTVAVAIQIVLVEGQVTTATPTNVALAINENCTSCETMALAYQYVFGNGAELQLSPEGKARLKELRKRLHDLQKRDDLTLEQIAAEVDDIAKEIGNVLSTELQPKESKSSGAGDETTTTTNDTAGSEATTSSTTAERSSSTTSTTSEAPSGTTTTTSAGG
jgi:putative peptide zinc metalloprotease protein